MVATDRERLQQARALLKAQQYGEARQLLQTIDHHVAHAWLEKLDRLQPAAKTAAFPGLHPLHILIIVAFSLILSVGGAVILPQWLQHSRNAARVTASLPSTRPLTDDTEALRGISEPLTIFSAPVLQSYRLRLLHPATWHSQKLDDSLILFGSDAHLLREGFVPVLNDDEQLLMLFMLDDASAATLTQAAPQDITAASILEAVALPLLRELSTTASQPELEPFTMDALSGYQMDVTLPDANLSALGMVVEDVYIVALIATSSEGSLVITDDMAQMLSSIRIDVP